MNSSTIVFTIPQWLNCANVLEQDTSHKITVRGAIEMQKSTDAPENDGFEIKSEKETLAEFSDECLELGDGITAYVDYCRKCGMKIVSINSLPLMFMLNVCWPDGNIFGSIEVCSNCVYDILKPKKS